jgi:hypothetical protein
MWCLQLKWPVPDETGGFMELKYTLELFPPPNVDVQEAEQPDEVLHPSPTFLSPHQTSGQVSPAT